MEMKKERNPERTRKVLLDSAEELFAAKGFKATSLAQIGEKAKVSRGTPSYFFGSKAGLYVAVKERLSQVVRKFAEEVGTEPTVRNAEEIAPREVLAAVVRSYIEFMAANPNYVRLVEREASGEDAEIKGASSPEVKMAESLGSFGIKFLEGEIQRGPIRQVDARKLAASIVALCSFPFLLNGGLIRTLGIETHDLRFLEEYKEHVIWLLLEGICERESERSSPYGSSEK